MRARPDIGASSALWKQFALLRLWCALLLALCTAVSGQAQDWSEPKAEKKKDKIPFLGTMDTVLEKAIKAFQSGNFAEAANLFEHLEKAYGREPEYKAEGFQQILLPAWAFAAFQAQEHEVAAEKFKQFLETYPEVKRGRDFAIYTLARTYVEMDELEDAIETYNWYRQEFPNADEAGLAWLEEGKLYFQLEKDEAGYNVLDELYRSRMNSKLRMQGRLIALKRAQDMEDLDRAGDLLLHTRWTVRDMPELAVLTFAALKIGDLFMDDRQYANALTCYRLVPPYETLIKLQKRRLTQTEEEARYKLKQLAYSNSSSFWEKFYRDLIAKIKGQLKGLEEAQDYTPGFMLRLGQTYLLLERNREAWIVNETLALDPETPADVREQAHFRWIVCAHALEFWDDALMIARDFVERYPNSPLAPQALYMSAEAYQKLRQYAKAVEVLSDLIERFPGHVMMSRWYFVRGLNYVLMEDNLKGREDFAEYAARFPNGLLIMQAKLWHALTYFFEKEYEPALKLFTELERQAANHNVLPEVVYRKASTLYAMKNYEDALVVINDYLSRFKYHKRIPEAEVLRGDILMGKGELDEAIAVFKRVGPEAESLFPYAVFQIGKIHKARAGAWEEEHPEDAKQEYRYMIAHFRNYLDREDVTNKIRLSEALYWIGWAHTQLGETLKAFPVFQEALDTYGNDPNAQEMLAILQALQKTHKTYRKETSKASSADPLLAAEDFMDWLNYERKQALSKNRNTYYARLSMHASDVYTKRKSETQATEMLFQVWENVPMADMDAETLGRIGVLVLEELKTPRQAEDYLAMLMEKYPTSYPRAYAYYGLGKIRYDEYLHHLEKEQPVPAADALESARSHLASFHNETPVHPVMTDATILYGRVLTDTGNYAKAQSIYEDLLRLRTARGRPHAKALLGLSRLHESQGNDKKAIAYAQRVYTVYRAYPDMLAPAYAISARLFEEIGDPGVAYRTYEEMLKDKRLDIYQEYIEAEKEFTRLDKTLPESVKHPPEPEPAPEAPGKESTQAAQTQ